MPVFYVIENKHHLLDQIHTRSFEHHSLARRFYKQSVRKDAIIHKGVVVLQRNMPDREKPLLFKRIRTVINTSRKSVQMISDKGRILNFDHICSFLISQGLNENRMASSNDQIIV